MTETELAELDIWHSPMVAFDAYPALAAALREAWKERDTLREERDGADKLWGDLCDRLRISHNAEIARLKARIVHLESALTDAGKAILDQRETMGARIEELEAREGEPMRIVATPEEQTQLSKLVIAARIADTTDARP